MRTISRIVVPAALTAMLAVPLAEARTRVYVRIGPPPIVVERQTVAPYPNYVWQPGYQQWTGAAYAWVPGRWVARPHRHARWVAGRWHHSHSGYYWEEGRWR
jgi:hypothetical protein